MQVLKFKDHIVTVSESEDNKYPDSIWVEEIGDFYFEYNGHYSEKYGLYAEKCFEEILQTDAPPLPDVMPEIEEKLLNIFQSVKSRYLGLKSIILYATEAWNDSAIDEINFYYDYQKVSPPEFKSIGYDDEDYFKDDLGKELPGCYGDDPFPYHRRISDLAFAIKPYTERYEYKPIVWTDGEKCYDVRVLERCEMLYSPPDIFDTWQEYRAFVK